VYRVTAPTVLREQLKQALTVLHTDLQLHIIGFPYEYEGRQQVPENGL